MKDREPAEQILAMILATKDHERQVDLIMKLMDRAYEMGVEAAVVTAESILKSYEELPS